MNVFVCEPAAAAAAAALADRHIVKMAVEAAQILWTAVALRGLSTEGGYRPTHAGHPCVRAAAADADYRWWLGRHGLALCAEYQHRYDRRHGAEGPLRLAIERLGGLSEGEPPVPAGAPQAMPDEYRIEGDPVAAYRRYLIAKYAAWHAAGRPARWSGRVPPAWWTGGGVG